MSILFVGETPRPAYSVVKGSQSQSWDRMAPPRQISGVVLETAFLSCATTCARTRPMKCARVAEANEIREQILANISLLSGALRVESCTYSSVHVAGGVRATSTATQCRGPTRPVDAGQVIPDAYISTLRAVWRCGG